MKNTFLATLAALCFVACASSADKDWIDVPYIVENSTTTLADAGDAGDSLAESSRKYRATFDDPDACIPQRFTADNIPADFVFDPNCPPTIYWPPRWIPPWDKSPVMDNPKQ